MSHMTTHYITCMLAGRTMGRRMYRAPLQPRLDAITNFADCAAGRVKVSAAEVREQIAKYRNVFNPPMP